MDCVGWSSKMGFHVRPAAERVRLARSGPMERQRSSRRSVEYGGACCEASGDIAATPRNKAATTGRERGDIVQSPGRGVVRARRARIYSRPQSRTALLLLSTPAHLFLDAP